MSPERFDAKPARAGARPLAIPAQDAQIVAVTAPDTHRAITAVYRLESPKLIARLARMVRDLSLIHI